MKGCPLPHYLTLKTVSTFKKFPIPIKKPPPPFSVNALKKLGQTVKL